MKTFKNAFTMLELIFVLVVIGILAVVMIPRMGRNTLYEAAHQLAFHIRYTQHLAMNDDKFDSNSSDWYKERWQLNFAKGNGTEHKWSYTIFSDVAGGSSGNPDPNEIAVNPLDSNKKLTGGSNGTSIIHTGDAEATASMNLGKKYGITNVDFSSSCTTGGSHPSKRIAFDYMGRPLYGAFHNYTKPYPADRIVRTQCIISLCTQSCASASTSEKIQIAIEPETGYIHIL